MDPIDILEQVNEFYNNAFGHLMTLTIAIIGLGGIVLPIVLQFIQNHFSKKERIFLERQIHNTVRTETVQLRQEINELFESEKAHLKDELHREILVATGIGLLAQARECASRGDFAGAAANSIEGIICALDAKEEYNARNFLKGLIFGNMPQLTKKIFDEYEGLEEKFAKLLGKLNDLNINGRYQSEIIDITRQIKRIHNEEDQPSEN